jgi:hypothetical protein
MTQSKRNVTTYSDHGPETDKNMLDSQAEMTICSHCKKDEHLKSRTRLSRPGTNPAEDERRNEFFKIQSAKTI